MKKKIVFLVLVLSLILPITGCKSSKSYTFKVETNDSIEVTLDNNKNGYDMKSTIPFIVKENGKNISEGTFIKNEYYKTYIEAAKQDSNYKIIDSSSNNDIEYIFYSYNNSEYVYVINIKNSKTGVVLTNKISEEKAKECFKLLTFKLKK